MAKARATREEARTPATRVVRRRDHPALPANRYGAQDTQSFALLDLERVTPAIMQRELGLTARTRALLTEARRAGGVWSALVDARLSVADATKLRGRGYLAGEAPLHIVDVMPVDGRIQSGRPFAIDISVQNVGEAPVVLASALVTWAGEPFVMEAVAEKGTAGTIRMAFDAERTLPVGQAEFQVSVFREDGAQASFHRTVYVLPSNPLSLSVGPSGATVTGTWSARGDYHPESDTFLTECEIVLANGDPRPSVKPVRR